MLLQVQNTGRGLIMLQDPRGYSDFVGEVPPDTTQTFSIAYDLLQRLIPQLRAIEATPPRLNPFGQPLTGLRWALLEDPALADQRITPADMYEKLPTLTFIDSDEVQFLPNTYQASPVSILLPDNRDRTLVLPVSFKPAVSGIGGLDTGVEAADTFYYIYAVPTAPGVDTLQIIGSVRDPSMGPVGYPSYRYIGCVRNDASSDIKPFITRGNLTKYIEAQVAFNIGTGFISTESTPVAIPVAHIVPKTASSMIANLKLQAQAAASGIVQLYVDGRQTLNPHVTVQVNAAELNYAVEDLPTPTIPKQIWRRLEEFTGDLEQFQIVCEGWYDHYL